MDDAPTLVVFDYDHTLITGDSFWSFLRIAAGDGKTLAALGQAVLALARARAAVGDTPHDDYRTFLKGELIRRLLGGKKPDDFTGAAARTRMGQVWNEPVRQKLLAHHAKGHHIVIASGALDVYLPELLKELPHHGIVCTQCGLDASGAITGKMPAGNCVRLRKAELVADYIKAFGPFGETWGYGNLPHDLPMLNLMQRRVII